MRKFFLTTLISLLSWSAFAQIIITVAGTGYCCSPLDGVSAITSSVYYPNDVFVDASGNIYIAEPNKIRFVNTSGIITTLAGTTGGYSGDGGPATSAKLEAYGVIVDPVGNIYAADQFNNVIRKINTSGIITTYAGTNAGFSGDGGQAANAKLNGPTGLAFDVFGNLYFADTRNNRIRKITTAGIISTIAGNGTGGYGGDGGSALSASLNQPMDIAFDAAGNLYIADWSNNRIRKINTSGIISTFAGTGVAGYSGDNGPAISAQLNSPSSVAMDGNGNLYITDPFNSRVRMVDPIGDITTIGGNGTWGDSGDGGPATSAQIGEPWAIALDKFGNPFIADVNFSRIRKISSGVGISELNIEKNISVFPNPNNGTFKIKLSNEEEERIEIYNTLGQKVFDQKIISEVKVTGFEKGMYYYRMISKKNISEGKIVID